MSLNLYLSNKIYLSYDEGKTYIESEEQVYWANITHNLVKMADQTVLYLAIWCPNELLDTKSEIKAKDIIDFLKIGLIKLKEDPNSFKKFNPQNGWGTYEILVDFVEKYLDACKEHPESVVGVSG